MLRKSLLSLTIISAVVMMLGLGTLALWSDLHAVTPNSFAAGSVELGDLTTAQVNLTDMAPGQSQTKQVYFNYKGTLPADIFIGARGTSSPGDASYFADHLNVQIVDGVGTWFNDKAKALSTNWTKIAANAGAGDKWYTITFTLDADTGNDHMGAVNSDTEFLIYAVQTGGEVPATIPYLTP